MAFNQAWNALEDGQDYAPQVQTTPGVKALLIDHGHDLGSPLDQFLAEGGYKVLRAADAGEAVAMTIQSQPDLILLDCGADSGPVGALLGELLMEQSRAAVVVLARDPSIEQAVEVIRLGALDYLPQPLDTLKLKRVVQIDQDLQ